VRYLFLCFAAVLLLAGLAIRLTEPDLRSEIPVIYWVIDPAPARGEQIVLFHLWQMKHGHGKDYELQSTADVEAFRDLKWTPGVEEAIARGNDMGKAVLDGTIAGSALPVTIRVPGAEMRLDAASNDLNKKLIQGVSGVAGDVIEAYSGGKQMQYLAASGMLADITASAREHGFGPDQTYDALAPALFYEGRQYAFPRNPAQTMYWVNKETFTRFEQPLPPSQWTVEEFERRGKAYVHAANPPGKYRKYFFADRALRVELRRSLGLSMFNETLTRCTLDDPRNAQTLELIRKWTYDDHILPSAADRASFDTEGGWGGQSFQLFKAGHYAMFASGRWALMLFRRFGSMQLAVVEPPHCGLRNTILSGGQSTVYRASPNRKYAELFLAYMASEDYNMQIVRDGDALPPNPRYTNTELFKRPPEYPNEWGCHEAYANAARDIAIVQSFSPFVLPVVIERYDQEAEEEVMNSRSSPQDAARGAAERVNAEIQRNLTESARMRERYKELCQRQNKIDERRAAGGKVPLEWIENPFYRHYYQKQGWIE